MHMVTWETIKQLNILKDKIILVPSKLINIKT